MRQLGHPASRLSDREPQTCPDHVRRCEGGDARRHRGCLPQPRRVAGADPLPTGVAPQRRSPRRRRDTPPCRHTADARLSAVQAAWQQPARAAIRPVAPVVAADDHPGCSRLRSPPAIIRLSVPRFVASLDAPQRQRRCRRSRENLAGAGALRAKTKPSCRGGVEQGYAARAGRLRVPRRDHRDRPER